MPDPVKPAPPPGNPGHDPVSQPYGGPYPNGVDATAGGADSSPFETQPTGTREDVAAHERYLGRGPDNEPPGDAGQHARD